MFCEDGSYHEDCTGYRISRCVTSWMEKNEFKNYDWIGKEPKRLMMRCILDCAE
jgi:hypothetical protein